MARARYVHPRVVESPSVAKLGPAGAFFWVGLILRVDDEGFTDDVPEALRVSVMGPWLKSTPLASVRKWLSIMADEGMIFRYVADDGRRYLQVLNFNKYNKPAHATPSKIPPPISRNVSGETSGEISGSISPRGGGGWGGIGLGASVPPSGGARSPSSTPQRMSSASPAGSAPAARAGGAAPARPASAPVLPPREKWPLTASDYLNREGWRVHPVTGQDTPPDGWVSPPVAGGPVEPAAPREPEPPPKITREERAAAVRAQAAAIKAQATPEQLAEIEERLAAQDAAAHPAPAAVEGGDA